MGTFESLGLKLKKRNLNMMKILVTPKLKLCSSMFYYFEEAK